MGDQAIALDVSKRLRELGFIGTIEFIFEENAHNKISKLLGTTIETNKISEFPDRNLRFIPMNFFNEHREHFVQADFAISPSFINTGSARSNYSAEISGKINPTYLKSSSLIVLQPTGFYDSQIIIKDENITVPGTKNIPIKTVISESHISNSVLEDPRAAFLKKLLNTSNTVDFSVGYGLGLYDGPIKVYRYLLAMHLTSMHRKDPTKPQVFALISKFNDAEKEKLFSLIQSNPNLKDKIGIVDPNLPDSAALIESNKLEGKISLSFLGNVPKDIFESLMQKSTYPPTVAGANSISLMQNLGRPYLVSTFYNYTDERSSLAREAKLKFMKASTALSRIHEPHDESANILKEFFLESLDPSSNLVAGFKANPSEDRLSLALRALAESSANCSRELSKIAAAPNSTAP